MLDILAQFDALGLGTLAGSLLLLAGFIWVLVDNRSFQEVSRRHREAVAPKAAPARTTAIPGPANAAADAMAVCEPADAKGPERDDPAGPGRGVPTRPGRGAPRRPIRTRRAA